MIVKSNNKHDYLKEVKEFLKNLLKNSSSNEICEVKIPDGAHGTIGKLITKICKKKINTKILRAKKLHNQYESLSSNFEENLDELDDQPSPFKKPIKREYILRSSVPRPAPYSRQSPQRMYCLLTDTEFRLAGAFTEDTMFF